MEKFGKYVLLFEDYINNEPEVICTGSYEKMEELFSKYHDEDRMDASTFKKLIEQGKKFNESDEYILVLSGGHVVGGIYVGMRDGMPFVYELATTGDLPGCGDILIDEFVKKYGKTFWLKCLTAIDKSNPDKKSAESFWRHAAEKRRWTVTNIGTTSWNTPILQMN